MEEITLAPYSSELDKRLVEFILDDVALKDVMRTMMEMIDRGLSDDQKVASTSSLKMLPSYLCTLPDGTETGDYLALDLGGTKFRVLMVKVEKGRNTIQACKIYSVPHEIMTGTGEKLFDHIADSLADFLREQKMEGKNLPLGFTFSFPCRQEGLKVARLITWTKGYKATGVEGHDVAKLLHEAIQRRMGGEVEVMAVLNDTVGTLMALAHEDPNCQIGISLGTGTNACYVEMAERCLKMKEYFKKTGFDKMIINMEWGGFGDLGELDKWRTDFDKEIDSKSINPGRQIFEKMISGMYLGELVRLILLKLTQEGLLFNGKVWDELKTPNRFHGRYVSDAMKCTNHCPTGGTKSLACVRQLLNDFGLAESSAVDCANVSQICFLIVKRAADLCAAGVAAVLNRLGKANVTAGIDGSVYRCNQPYFHDFLCAKVKALLSVPCELDVKLAPDGSGRGAALVAAVASRVSKRSDV